MLAEKGSEWRKWDLHVHTPVSLVHNYSGSTEEKKWETFVADLEQLPEEFKVIGINDYLFIDGYEKVLEYKKKGRLKNIDTFFPVIEFRIKKFGGHKEFKRVNFHVIFSDKLEVDIIRQQFLSQLYGKYKLAPGNEGIEWYGVITLSSLADLGRQIKASVPEGKLTQFGSDTEEGFNNVNFDEEVIIDILKSSTYLKDKFLTAIGKTEWDSFKWDDNSIAEKKSIINKVDFVFTSSETINHFNNAKSKLIEQKVTNLLFDCSDAHHNCNSTNKDRIGKCYTWVKADTTFDGLKQVIYEPDRLFVGSLPQMVERLKTTPNKFIAKLEVQKVQGCEMGEVWYDSFAINLNPGLIAIIGNKGNGKSAITDILGLSGNSYNDKYSFLTKHKFRNPRPYNRAANFSAAITWADGTKDESLNLNASIDKNKAEKVKYIPQNFLESLCVDQDEQEFEREIKTIIFSHTPDGDKMGFTDLDELINYKSEVINKELGQLKVEIEETNQKIIAFEKKALPSFRKSTEDALHGKEQELRNHETLKPLQVLEPTTDENLAARNDAINQELNRLRENLSTQISRLEAAKSEKALLLQDIVEIGKLNQSVENLQRTLVTFSQNQQAAFQKFGIDENSVISYVIKAKPIQDVLVAKQGLLDKLNVEISGDGTVTGLEKSILENQGKLKELENRLDEPYRIYQKYIQELTDWEARKKSIIGTANIQGSIQNLQQQIKYLDEKLEQDLQAEYMKRDSQVRTLFSKKSEFLKLYEDTYMPITRFIADYGHLMKNYHINLSAEFTLDGFSQKFFDHVSQGAKGSYIGIEEGNKFLNELLPLYDLNKADGVIEFLQAIKDSLFFDKRTEQNEEREPEKQLKKGYTIEDLYNFLFSLEYLKPIFKLNLGDKSLSTLSPGERGALLLIFYLFLDKDDKPLIIDQPEENLDNQSVYRYLVHFIKEAKQRRQIIMVTHNPNLAVVCDAEQVVQMTIDKTGKHRVAYVSGAIENPIINKTIVDILEGTKPAFKNRTNKYSLTTA